MLIDFHVMYKKYDMNVTGVIHIGGHIGQEYDIYKQYSSIKDMIFFEPDPDTFKILENKTKDDKSVVCINNALGPFTCTSQFNRETNNEGQSNSILEPKVHLQQYPNIVFTDKIDVRVHPLDKYEPGPTLNMINIDVQGFELMVFMGARTTLSKVDYIYTEINRAEVYENCAHVDDLDWFLAKYKFKRVETTWDGGTWGDALYVKEK
jgi:FkbM family methyltransferase